MKDSKITVRLTERLLNDIKLIAKENNCSISAIIRELTDTHVKVKRFRKDEQRAIKAGIKVPEKDTIEKRIV